MSVIGGMNGAVDGHAIVRGWAIAHSADIKSMVASNTLGGSITLEGNENWSGTFRQYGYIPAVLPGAAFTFTGSIDGSDGAYGPARVTSVTINWGQEAGEPIAMEIAFQANGALVLGAAAVSDTADFENVGSSVGVLVKIADAGGAFAALDDVRSAQLVLTAANREYRSSTSDGHTKSVEGPLDWSLSIDMYSGADLSALPTVNLVQGFQLFVNATEHWELLWGRVGEMTNLDVNIETGDLVSGTLNASMHGIQLIGETVTDGTIKDPAETTIWP